MKITTAFVLSACATLALAATLTVGSKGRGAATTTDGRRATFDYEVTKRTDGAAAPVFAGRFHFEQRAVGAGGPVVIDATAPTTLGVNADGRVCEFSGRGRLTRVVDRRTVTVGGTLSVRAQDRRAAGATTGDRDLLRVRFVPESGASYSFEGTVVEGDLSPIRR